MTPLEHDVLRYITQNPDQSDAQIAQGLGRPAPSVRRSRNALESRGQIRNSSTSFSGPLTWRAV